MNIKRHYKFLSALALVGLTISANARENGAIPGGRMAGSGRYSSGDQLAASCTPATAKTDMDINNVRTTIMSGGDMWWDLVNAQYEVPKGGGAHSIFAGALWIGGLDAGGQLKVAAMTYRQTGNDFWPGPLDTTTVSIDGSVCTQYDKHFKITRQEVADWVSGANTTMPLSVLNWPGNGDQGLGQGRYLAPFVDVDGDGVYNPFAGDYPAYDLNGTLGCSKFQLFGDQTLWWVFNDKGNVHSESGAAAIGLEIQAQAFAFATNDEINNMTFYTYKVINRSTVGLNDTYIGQWTDSDLGDAFDDYVGCDVKRGLGYTYNGRSNDGGNAVPSPGTYGANPPALGMDFFEGPLADPGDGVDNDRDSITDEPNEQIIMSKFVYYDNNFTVRGNPENATHFYNYLTGFWKDGSPLTYGGNAYGGSTPCDFMFPGDSDPYGWGTNGIPQAFWDEVTAGNTYNDRRIFQSAGPITLQPGAVNYITVGAVWARASNGGPTASVDLLRTVDDKAQSLFNNCFRTLDGPDAPDVTIQELDKELVIYFTNAPNSNNYLEGYEATDPNIVYQNVDATYNFEGYQLFQLKDASVSAADVYDPDKARLVAQCDLRNGIAQLVNLDFDQSLNTTVPTDMTIDANDNGISHSFSLKEDAFATGNRQMVNHKTYYYLALAYAYNNYIQYSPVTYDPLNPLSPSNIGQKFPYKAGRRNISVYAGIPHISSPEANGTSQQSSYGMGPKITRVEGTGTGTNVVDLTEGSINAIMSATTVNNGGNSRVDEITYENGRGPVNVKVVDPLNVPEGDFQIALTGNPYNSYTVSANTTWVLTQTSPQSRSWSSERSIQVLNEQIIPELGLSVSITQIGYPGVLNNPDKNGYLESTLQFADPTKDWLSGVSDDDSNSESNWLRAGTVAATGSGPCDAAFNDYKASGDFIDPDGEYEKLISGTWGPYRLCAKTPSSSVVCYTTGPAWDNAPSQAANSMNNLANVDIVLTNDKSKWTRCIVLETGPNATLNQSSRAPFLLRAAPSVDKEGNVNQSYDFPNGMSWFPGYAINVETGERLNMAFGENSALAAERGRDMKWNPTSNERTQFFEALFGGMHYVYVFGHNGNARYGATPADLANKLKDVPAYDECRAIADIMNSSSAATERGEIFRDAMWVNIPMLDREFSDWNFDYAGGSVFPTDAKIRLRVAKPYERFYTGVAGGSATPVATDSAAAPQNANNPLYKFNTSDLRVLTNNSESAVNALDLINVVPNPYYAYSGYEKNQFDNRIKFTNLPEKCTIRIYTVSGTQVRKYTKDSPITSLDWDLKNQAGIPVASGLYIIHVDVPGVGEKILKWFGVMRPIDLDSY
jgi:hypothetical protein